MNVAFYLYLYSMRGQYSLFNEFVEVAESPKGGKGRSADLIDARNECMMYRYYYLIRIKKMQYLDALDELAAQFFISTMTVIYQLQKNEGRLRAIMREEAAVKKLSKKFPWLNW